jgi:hypothetical protein
MVPNKWFDVIDVIFLHACSNFMKFNFQQKFFLNECKSFDLFIN